MKQRIAVVSGGYSGEYQISVRSGEVIRKFLNKDLYDVYGITVERGKVFYTGIDGSGRKVDLNDFSIVVKGEKITFDCIFIAIHGTPGEDGRLQGYFDLLGIPYTGCDIVTSSLTFNKDICKQVVSNIGIRVANSVLVRKGEDKNEEIIKSLRLPLFIKPNNGGSSVGMSKVNSYDGLPESMEVAFREDSEVIVEEYIPGREITCGVLKNGNEIIVLPVTEIISKKEFFDFEAKYDPKLADEIVPARIPEQVAHECRDTSSRLYGYLNCRGVVRFDYIFNEEGLFFLEVNTIPGLTEESIVPKMADSYGMKLEKLFGIIVEQALRR